MKIVILYLRGTLNSISVHKHSLLYTKIDLYTIHLKCKFMRNWNESWITQNKAKNKFALKIKEQSAKSKQNT